MENASQVRRCFLGRARKSCSGALLYALSAMIGSSGCPIYSLAEPVPECNGNDSPENELTPEQCKIATDPDDTASLQRAAASAQTVILAERHTYTVCESIVGLRFRAEGEGAGMKLCPHFHVPTEPGNSFIHNRNFYSPNKIDLNASIYNIHFDGSNADNNGTFHAVQFRQVSGIDVRHISCHHVGDCTAFISDDGSIVSDAYADEVGNVGFDHWDGPKNAVVEGSTVICGSNGDQIHPVEGDGIMFTASSGQSPGIGENLMSIQNHITGKCGVGLDFNNLWQKSSIINALSIGDVVDLQGGAYLGIRMSGNIVDGRIIDPQLKNGNGGFAVGIVGDSYGGNPSAGQIVHPRISGWNVSKLNVAWIVAMGRDARIIDASVMGGHAPSFYRFDDSSSLIIGPSAPVDGRSSGQQR